MCKEAHHGVSGLTGRLLINERYRLALALAISVSGHLGVLIAIGYSPGLEVTPRQDQTFPVAIEWRTTEPRRYDTGLDHITPAEPTNPAESDTTSVAAGSTTTVSPTDSDIPAVSTAPADPTTGDSPASSSRHTVDDLPLIAETRRSRNENPYARTDHDRATADSSLSTNTPTIVEPRPVNAIVPVYPLSARRRGIEGEVVIRVIVSARGTPVGAEILQPARDPRLNSAALAAVEAALFEPGTVDSRPREMPVNIHIVFQLTGGAGA